MTPIKQKREISNRKTSEKFLNIWKFQNHSYKLTHEPKTKSDGKLENTLS